MPKITQPRKKCGSVVKNKPSNGRKKKTFTPNKRIFSESTHYGTSKLEVYFAKNFLDKMNLMYVYEYEASDIGRFYDFAIVAIPEDREKYYEEKNGIVSLSQKRNHARPCLIIEVDGSYFHGDPRLVEESKMNSMQKKNKIVDEFKDDWCRVHHIPILRLWEYDIYNNPKLVMGLIKESLDKLETFDKEKVKKRKKFFTIKS